MLYIFCFAPVARGLGTILTICGTSQKLHFHLITNSENNLNEIINDVASAQPC